MNIEQWLSSDLSIDIWEKKYQYDNESFEDWLKRITNNDSVLAELIREKKFLFAGRILANRGLQHKGKKVTLSNCYVIEPPKDNIEDIYRCCSDIARTFSMGGGCGIVLDNLRPRGAIVNNSAKTTTGAVSFMDTFSKVSETIGQNGRRGALMIALDVNHPDIEEFIDIKTDLSKVLGANISVKVDDAFMNAVLNDDKHICKFVVEETREVITKELQAKEVFMKLVQNNYDYAEPGILYWDTFNKNSLLSELIKDGLFEYAGTNPCAEEPLPSGGACLLGSINLSEYVINPFTDNAYFDTDALQNDIPIYIDALNDVLKENTYLHPLSYQTDSSINWRQIGLGVMGIADVFIKLGIAYGSRESVQFLDNIGHVIAYTSLLHSCYLNIDLPYHTLTDYSNHFADSYFVKQHSNPDIDNNFLATSIRKHGLYNSALLTVAPTGTLSTMLGVSGGIEPIFATSYTRRTMIGDEEKVYKVYTPIIQDLMEHLGIDDEDLLPSYVVTAHDLNPMQRIDIQATMQKHIDASISSTINLNEDATEEDVFNIYIEAWKRGCKGITIFRNNCKRLAILNTNNSDSNSSEVAPVNSLNVLPRGYIVPTNDNTFGLKRKIIGGCGSLHIQAYFDYETGKMSEVFISKGSQGGCNSNLNALSRMISLALRGGIAIEDIVDQLGSTINCPSFASARAKGIPLSQGSSCASAVGKVLLELNKEFQDMYAKVTEVQDVVEKPNSIDTIVNVYKPYIAKHGEIEFMKSYHKCPMCFSDIEASGGCMSCPSCSYSKCE